jgi:hypothetical protein
MLERHPIQPRLFRCEVCGEWAGIVNWRLLTSDQRSESDRFSAVLCSCDGPLCCRCGKNRIHRPISDYYNEADGRVWHVPYFAGMAPCRECRGATG